MVETRRQLGWRLLGLWLGCCMLSACVATPPIVGAPTRSPAPHHAGAYIERYLDVPVLWGGSIVEVRQFDGYAEMEIIAYPLDSSQRPLFDRPDQGRFIAVRAGTIDRSRFSSGRYLTLHGPITGERNATWRGKSVRIAEVDAREIALWPVDYRFQRNKVAVSIGISGGF